MKVERPTDKRPARAGEIRRGTAVRKGAGTFDTGSFQDKLYETRRDLIREELDALLSEIDKHAREIEKSLTFDSLTAYKQLIKKFLDIVVNDLYKVEDKLEITSTGRKKSYQLIKKIDTALDEIATEFMQKQSGLIGFMSRIDQIRGMLLDLYS